MRVLVTGSEGSLMQWVIPRLIDAGHEVRGVDNFSRYGEIERQRRYDFVEGDLCDQGLVASVMKDADVVIQGAAQIYGVRGFHKYPADILSKDVELQNNLLNMAVQQGIERFVFISSSMVYERSEEVPTEEAHVEDMRVPHTDYGLSKLMGERLCQAYQHQYGVPYTIWRPFNIITPYEEAEAEEGIAHVFADFIRKVVLERQNPMSILGDGEQVRCFTWIDDVAQAIADYSFSGETSNEAFNLGNPNPVTMKELALRIFAKAQEKGLIATNEELAFTHQPIYEDDVRVRIPSVDKAKAQLDWAPTVDLDAALDRCIDEVADRALSA
ncbi:MAG: NAD-dependent epimerase/dehydratase family protein [Salinibacter sp.]